MDEKEVFGTVRRLCKGSSDYKRVLEGIIRIEEHGLFNERFGWKMEDVPNMTGGHVKGLLDAGLIRRDYTSQKYKHFRLVPDTPILKEALKSVSEERIGHEELRMMAEKRLREDGYEIISLNGLPDELYNIHNGIKSVGVPDIIAKKGDELLFVEVKGRERFIEQLEKYSDVAKTVLLIGIKTNNIELWGIDNLKPVQE